MHKTETAEKDDYQYKIPASQCVMKCNYLELFWESKGGDIYYIEEKKVALISAYCIAVIRPELKPCQENCWGKWVDMFQVSHDMHKAILELLDSGRFLKNICYIQCAMKRCAYWKNIEQLISVIKM